MDITVPLVMMKGVEPLTQTVIVGIGVLIFAILTITCLTFAKAEKETKQNHSDQVLGWPADWLGACTHKKLAEVLNALAVVFLISMVLSAVFGLFFLIALAGLLTLATVGILLLCWLCSCIKAIMEETDELMEENE